ncbi:NmrA family NAD(P)-binding protein [Duganella sp. FT50W]|uniref:NmrA family NAD(P)-binding protein n=1 Tax=Duganella lactea TaxID=2692173 RepID=A0A6L8MSI1_9BURK|nr:NmrA family NAD(P)-binding protein [Duganella lactea]MYM85002.1 NmrA family NAD(P)-binding protein [Duganella lactea]
MTFIIHGATGAQGGPLIKRLLATGKPALAAVRNAASANGMPAVAVDNASVDSLVAAYRHAEGVFFHLPLAAETERVQYARNFAQAIALARPARIIISTSGNVVDEPGSPIQVPDDSAVAVLLREVARTGVSCAVVAPRLYLENLLLPIQFDAIKAEGVLRYPLRSDYQVSWSSHLDVAEVVESLLADPTITGIVGLGHEPGLAGSDLAAGFAQHLGMPVRYEAISPEAFGVMLTPLFGAGPAAGVVAGYQAKAQTKACVIANATSAQSLLGLQPRSVQHWLADVLG